jgi:tRNA 2-thiouridine synthesizing protein A
MPTQHKAAFARLDLAGLKCPLPVLKVRKALLDLPQGTILEALCTDPMAGIDIPELAMSMQARLLNCQKTAKGLLFRIEKP